MVCFCDIPLSRVDEHVQFYGQFGIGLTKEWAISNGLTPIHYVSHNSSIAKKYISLAEINEEREDENKEKAKEVIRHLLAHTKPIQGNMFAAPEIVKKEFQQECEWRYVAENENIHDHIGQSSFYDEDEFLKRNGETKKNCMLAFSLNDIKYVFVPRDSDIPEMVNFIQVELDDHPSSDVKLLMSRITSLESIGRDL